MSNSWTIQRKLGSSAFGAVYLASSADDSMRGVLKLPFKHASATVDQARLRTAVGKTTAAHHDCVAQPIGIATTDERVGVLFEYIDAVDIGGLVTTGPLPPKAALELVAKAASGLDAAWSTIGRDGEPLYWKHGDLLPTNILLTQYGDVKVSDFGLTWASQADGGLDMDSTAVFSSLAYMSPERLVEEPSDADDVYSLGVVLYKLLTGAVPRSPAYVDREIHETRLEEVLDALARVLGDGHDGISNLVDAALLFEHEARPSRGAMARKCTELAATAEGESLAEWAATKVKDAIDAQKSYKLQSDKGVEGSTFEVVAVEDFVPEERKAVIRRRTTPMPRGTWTPKGSRPEALPSVPPSAPSANAIAFMVLGGASLMVIGLGLLGFALLT